MGVDLGKMPQSIVLSLVIFVALIGVTVNMGQGFGTVITQNNTYNVTTSFKTIQLIETAIQEQGSDATNTFFPAIGSLYTFWTLTKAALKDFTNMVENTIIIIGGGNATAILIIKVMLTCLAFGLAVAVLGALFRVGGFKSQG